MSRKASARIPASGLPIALETLMNTLLDSFELKSWNIYNDFNGACCLKIRWRPPQNSSVTTGESQQVQSMKYKKKSPSAQNRDYNRSAAYHTSTSQIRTRSMTTTAASVESKEMCRAADIDISERNMPDSPITVQSDIPIDTSVICSPSGLNSTLNESVNHGLLTGEPQHTPTIDCPPDHISSPQLDSDIASYQDSECQQQSESDIDEEYIQRGPVCDICNCYFHNTNTHEYAVSKYKDFKVFKCSKCPIILCIRCFEGGGAHKEHSKYLAQI